MAALSRYLRLPVRHARWLVVAAAMFSLLGVWLGIEALQLQDAAAQARDRADRLRDTRASMQSRKPNAETVEKQKRWTALQRERDFPWPRLFQAIEQVDNPEIELLDFLPDKHNRIVVLHGEARNHQALIDYLHALAAGSTLSNVHLTHQQKAARGPLETVAFEIKATMPD